MGTLGRRTAAIIVLLFLVWLTAGSSGVRSRWTAALRSACGPNPIVCENLKPGDADFEISGAGGPSIQGFATDISTNVGQTVSFKIAAPGAASYQIAIYRLGYYGGAGARKVATIVPSALPVQPACIRDIVTGLIDCGNWTVSASWPVPDDAVSGIYLAKPTRPDNGESSHIVFIVRDDNRRTDVLLQTSDTTWQAYNRYGGASLYCADADSGGVSNSGSAYANSCAMRAAKVSYNRPFDTRAHDPQSFVFSAEYPMVRFLEANGYDVKYWAGVDTDRRAADLVGANKPSVFISSGHDEYWSSGQRAGVEAARGAGVNLAFFSGNEVYWKTRYEPSAASADAATSNPAYRTLVSYKDTLAGTKIDPMSKVATGTWRDTRFSPPVADGGRPENALMGSIWTVNSGTAAITVPAAMSTLRFWRNTRVATLGGAVLSPSSLGYEWGEDLDNGSRPGGLIQLSSTTVNAVEKVIDFGATVGSGTATHSLTLYRHDSGALVFGASTVQWAWGLDGAHDDHAQSPSSHAPDQAMQQATINLLADMDAQPGSLQSGLIAAAKSTDAFAPSTVITSPAAGSTVGSGDRVTISGTASDSGGGTVAGVEVSVDGGTTWRAAQGTAAWSIEWSPGALGSATIRARAVDDSGNRETAATGVPVSVIAGRCPCPSLWSATTVPPVPDVDDPSPLEVGLKFRSDVSGLVQGVRFYKSAMNTGTHIGNLWTSGGILLASAMFEQETDSGWQQVLFDAPVMIAADTTYVVSYHTNVGHYAASSRYFSSLGVDASPLHAPPAGSVGGNGVYAYGPTGFPTETFNATNYWVDLVFDITRDTSTPVIGDVTATTIDGSIAVIAWATSEEATSRLDYSTDSAFPSEQTISISDAALVVSHSVRITGLRPDTHYFFRLESTDRAGNVGTWPPAGPGPQPGPGGTPPRRDFTTPGATLHDTMSADFAAGTSTRTYVAETSDGELTLAPAGGTEFGGATLPPDWSTLVWSPGGSAAIDRGTLVVDGARVAQEQANVQAGHSLEFAATFTGDPYQHSGFGQSMASTDEPVALFSTSWVAPDGTPRSGGSLAVRTSAGGGAETSTNLGTTLFNAPHRFRIDWQPAAVTYYVDGVQVASHAVTITSQMRPVAASDYSVFSGRIVVDWMRMTPYAADGTFLSRVFDAGTEVDWDNIHWTTLVPDGTALTIGVRTGNSATPDATWTDFAAIAAPGALGLRSRYIQYRADMTSTDPGRTPELRDLIITSSARNNAPVANADSFTVNEDSSLDVPAAAGLLSNDADAEHDTLTARLVTPPSHGALALNANGSFSYTPAPDYAGSDTFTYVANDGHADSAAAAVQIVVNPVNDAPSFVAGAHQAVLEDSGSQIVAGWATAISAGSADEAGQTLNFLVTNSNNALFAAQPAVASGGTLTFTPAANANGSATVTVQLHDDGGTSGGGVDVSAAKTFTISVAPVNDPPSFIKGANQSMPAGAPAQTVPAWATGISAGANETSQALNFVVTNDNNSLFSVQPAVSPSGSLTYTPRAGMGGLARVTVLLHDNGGTADGGLDSSAGQVFTITIAAPVVNAPPVVSDTVVWNNDPTIVEPVARVGTAFPVKVSFTDSGIADRHTVTYSWGDNSTSPGVVTETGGAGAAVGTHVYTQAGFYTVTASVSDGVDTTTKTLRQSLVVVDPSGKYETGSGSFASPVGAVLSNPALAGSGAINALTARHGPDGTLTYAGNTNAFRFTHATGGISLTSTKMTWLVVSGNKSWLKGEGNVTIAGVVQPAEYLVAAVDATATPGVDKVRVKIVSNGKVVYDTQRSAVSDTADATTSTPIYTTVSLK